MALTETQVIEKIKSTVPKFGVDPELISLDAKLEALNLDSLDLIELMQSIEDEFGVQVPDENLEGAMTLGDAVDAVLMTNVATG